MISICCQDYTMEYRVDKLMLIKTYNRLQDKDILGITYGKSTNALFKTCGIYFNSSYLHQLSIEEIQKRSVELTNRRRQYL